MSFNWLIPLFVVALSIEVAFGDNAGNETAVDEVADEGMGNGTVVEVSGGTNGSNNTGENKPGGRTVTGQRFDPCNPNFCPSTTHCVDRNGRADCVSNVQQPCSSNPCLNGGVCHPKENSYICVCPHSYTGPRCEQHSRVPLCSTSPCFNGGTCHETGVSYTCACPPNYSGPRCASYSPPNPCATLPCLNGGTCHPSGTSYTCACVHSYSGTKCEHYHPSNPCASSPCVNGGTCHQSGVSYACACLPNYSGLRCQSYSPPNPCATHPCLNGGTCNPSGASYTCACVPSYSGPKCEQYHPPNPCASTPCVNGGTCHQSGVSYACACLPSYSGLRCESYSPPTPCATHPCLNGGTCNPTGASYTCACILHYSGLRCETYSPPNPCGTHPCLNGGTCHVSGSSYTCACVPSYSGLRCEHYQPPNPCAINPCFNGGTCHPSGSSFTCTCLTTYSGSKCELHIPPNPCAQHHCLNGGTCQPSGVTYTCRCPTSYVGSRCESYIPPNVCAPNPCLNGGSCNSAGKSYTCTCINKYTGSHCEIADTSGPVDRGHCQFPFSPCRNGCQCVPSCRHSSGYFCRSTNGYLGKNCTIPPPTVQCLPNQITVTVDDAFLREYNMGVANTRLHLAHSAKDAATHDCFAVTTTGISHTFTITLPFVGKCGTSVQVVGEQTVVSNNIWLNRYTNRAYDMPVPVICFECLYTKEYMIVTSLRPTVEVPAVLKAQGSSRVQGSMELCKVSTSCPNACPATYRVTQGNVYTVGELIHLNIKGDLSSHAKVALKSLHLSCDGNGGSAGVVQLVSNGCPAVTAQNYMPTKITHSALSTAACASFQVPRLHGCDVFFIHASLEICSHSCTYNSMTCHRFHGRRKRSSESQILDGSYGPFYLLLGTNGVPREILFPNRSIVDSPAVILDAPLSSANDLDAPEVILDSPLSPSVEELNSTWIVVGVSVLCLLLILSIGFAVVYNYRTSLPRKSSSDLSNCVLKFK